jgi:hypothetical protein
MLGGSAVESNRGVVESILSDAADDMARGVGLFKDKPDTIRYIAPHMRTPEDKEFEISERLAMAQRLREAITCIEFVTLKQYRQTAEPSEFQLETQALFGRDKTLDEATRRRIR